MSWEHAAGASAARWKLAGFLLQFGILVRSSRWGPPSDQDFIDAILEAVRNNRVVP